MPAVYAHRRFGEFVFAALPEPLKKPFKPFKDCYLLGFEGPDILFYHKPFKSNATKTKGMQLHLLSAKEFFINCAKKIENQDATDKLSTPLAAYVAGFICHFCLDNACHPKIYELEFTGVSHGLIESEFDKYVMRADGAKVFGNNPAQPILDQNGARTAAADVLEVKESEVKRAIKTIRFINGAFVCKSKFIHKIIHLFLKMVKKENSFGGMLIHHDDDPKCQAIMDGLFSDLQNAVKPTALLVEDYFAHLGTTAQTGVINVAFDKNYTGGILDEHHQPISRNQIGEETDHA